MNILTLIRAVPGVGPYPPYVMMLPLALGARSGAGSNPAAESAATAYTTLPLCAPALVTTGGNNAPLCSKASITAQIKTAHPQAYALVAAAEAADGDPTSMATAETAVATLLTLVPTLAQRGPRSMRIALITTLIQLIQMGITVAPQIIAAAQTAVSLIEGGTAPTPAQQAEIDAALDAAHAALQSTQPA